MELEGFIYLAGVIAAFASFAGVLGWVAHVDYKRPTQVDPAVGED